MATSQISAAKPGSKPFQNALDRADCPSRGGTWTCDGSITITAVEGQTYSFTFASTSCKAAGLPALGSMIMTGEGKVTQ